MDCAVLCGEKATLNTQTETQRPKQHQATQNSVRGEKTEKLARVRTERVLLKIHLLKHTKLGQVQFRVCKQFTRCMIH